MGFLMKIKFVQPGYLELAEANIQENELSYRMYIMYTLYTKKG